MDVDLPITPPATPRKGGVKRKEPEPDVQLAGMNNDDQGHTRGSAGTGHGADVIARPIMRNTQKMEDLNYRMRWNLVLYTFGMCSKTISTTAAWLLQSMYVFNPAHLGQYVTPEDLQTLNGLASFGWQLKVENITGSLKLIGINAPYIQGGADQTATNSQVTLMGYKKRGLERQMPMYQGQCTTTDVSAQLTAWDIDAQNGGYNWHRAILPAPQTGNISATVGAITQLVNGADSNLVEYTTTAGTISPTNGTQFTGTGLKGSDMDIIKITDSEGTITSWNHNMKNCYLSTQRLNRAGTLVSEASITIGQDILASLPNPPATSATGLQNVAPISLRKATNPQTQATLTQHVYMAHNNVYESGSSDNAPLELPEKEYLLLVPPPTYDPTKPQDLYMQVVLDTTMRVSVMKDHINSGQQGTQRNGYYKMPKSKFFGDSNVWFHGNPATSINE